MVLSTMILGTVMILGKTLGKDVSNQQAYIQKQFHYKSLENNSKADMMLANFSAEELGTISYRGTIFAVIVMVSFILVLSAAILVGKKYPLTQSTLPESR